MHVELLAYWMRKAKSFNPLKYEPAILRLIKFVTIRNLNRFIDNYDNCLGISVLNTLLDKFLPDAKQRRTDNKMLEENFVSLVMLYFSAKPDKGVGLDKCVELLTMLCYNRENFLKALDAMVKNAEHYSFEQLLEIARMQQPHDSVTEFRSQTLDIISSVLDKLQGDVTMKNDNLPQAVKQLLTWALDLCTKKSETVNAAFSCLVVVMDKHCVQTPCGLELVLGYLASDTSNSEMLMHAACLGTKLPKTYGAHFKWLVRTFAGWELKKYLSEQSVKALKQCAKFSPTGVQDYLQEIKDIREHCDQFNNVYVRKILKGVDSHISEAEQVACVFDNNNREAS